MPPQPWMTQTGRSDSLSSGPSSRSSSLGITQSRQSSVEVNRRGVDGAKLGPEGRELSWEGRRASMEGGTTSPAEQAGGARKVRGGRGSRSPHCLTRFPALAHPQQLPSELRSLLVACKATKQPTPTPPPPPLPLGCLFRRVS